MISNSVLFVDDDEFVYDLIKRKLGKYNFTLYFAKSPEEAIDIVANNEINVIVSDLRMPGMNGIIMLEKIQEISPNTVRIVMSSLRDINSILLAVVKGKIFKYITKPIKYEQELVPAIQESLEVYGKNIFDDISYLELETINLNFLRDKIKSLGVGDLTEFVNIKRL